MRVKGNPEFTDITNFEFFNFYLSAEVQAGDTMLVTQTATIDGSQFGVALSGQTTPLQPGDQVTLLQTTVNLDGTMAAGVNLTAPQGALLEADFDVQQTPTAVVATLRGIRVRAGAGAVGSGHLSGLAWVNRGTDFLFEQGFQGFQPFPFQRGLHVFGAVAGGSLHYKTSSDINIDGYNLITGATFGDETRQVGAFFEHGKGDYTSNNTFTSGVVKGNGDTRYEGVGLLGHFRFAETAYFELSVRAGRVETDYRSNGFPGSNGARVQYETKSHYVGAHAGFGNVWKLSAENNLDTYARAIWTRQSSDSTTLSTGEALEFDAVTSKRLRLGARFNHAFTQSANAYVGAAWDREFDGRLKATANGYAIESSTLKGNSGMLEVGVTTHPAEATSVDFGVQGYRGNREGVTGSLRINYRF